VFDPKDRQIGHSVANLKAARGVAQLIDFSITW
jgi:hypothetical protein